MVETNENKKKSRIFGGRRAKFSPEKSEPTVAAAPETVPVEKAQAKRGTALKSAEPNSAELKSAESHSAESHSADPKKVEPKKAGPKTGISDGTAVNTDSRKTAPSRKATPPKSAATAAATKPLSAAGSPDSDPSAQPAKRRPAALAPVSPLSPLFQAPDLPPMSGKQSQRSNDDHQRSHDDQEASTVRRRTRRRSGEEGGSDSAQPNTVVKVRQPRQQPAPSNEPQRVKGSTRLEAKKQRRRDGRDAGRRRPVITEAEFLARRESVDRAMVVRSKDDRIQIGVIEDDVLVEHYVAKSQEASLIGNVYLGRVQNVLPSMEAAFVDIGRGRNAVLYSGEVDWEAAAENAGEGKQQARRIELALKPGDKVLVQVTKDPVGHKGARLTSQVSLPGRFLVYVPNGSMNGISRKLPDTERARLKKILKEVLPDNVGVIVRTAAEGATEEQLTLDVNRLTQQWAQISTAVENSQAPALLHSEPDLLVKIIRDVFNEDFHKLVVSGDDAMATIESYLKAVAPDLADRVLRHEGPADPFDEFRITEQIEKALDRKVWLPSGGSLVIDRTEAMTVVDVNTGKFVGSGGNLEETVTKNNLEAAEEIVRQLRLRDIGGIIVVDFIDMVLESNRDLVLRRLVECLSRDRTKHQVAEVTSLGLIQMTRKKLGLGLLESFSESCEVCAGRGIIVHHDPVTKHRQSPQPEPKRGSSRKGGQQQSQKNGNGASGGTHAITDDVKNALAKIAASTIAPVVELHDQVSPPAEGSPEETVAILDIPVTKSSRSSSKISAKDAEQLLDSVLDALPGSANVASEKEDTPPAKLTPVVQEPAKQVPAKQESAEQESAEQEPAEQEPVPASTGRARTSRRASSAGLAAKSAE